MCPRIATLLGIWARDAAISFIKLAALPCMPTPPLGNMAKSALSMISMRKPCLSRVIETWSFISLSFLFSASFCSISFSNLSKSAFSLAAATSFFCSGVSLSGSEYGFSFSWPGSVLGLGPPSERGVRRSNKAVCLAEKGKPSGSMMERPPNIPLEPANWPNGIKLCEAGLK